MLQVAFVHSEPACQCQSEKILFTCTVQNLEECTGIVWHPVNGTVPFVNVGLSHYLQTISM